MARKQIKLSEVIALLEQGYVKWEKSASEDHPSIQAHFGLNSTSAKALFSHPVIAKMGVRYSMDIDIIEDVDEQEETTSVVQTSGYLSSSGAEVTTAILGHDQSAENAMSILTAQLALGEQIHRRDRFDEVNPLFRRPPAMSPAEHEIIGD
jgi:hypothetical protein